MLLWILNIFYVLIAVAMIGLILMQRGAGAQAGSGFGGGASGTVFGARGASNFLSKSTKWLAIAFFGISLGMAWLQLSGSRNAQRLNTDLGVMPGQGQPAAPASQTPSIPVAPAAAPATQPAGEPAAQPASTPVQQNAVQEKAPQGG